MQIFPWSDLDHYVNLIPLNLSKVPSSDSAQHYQVHRHCLQDFKRKLWFMYVLDLTKRGFNNFKI